MIKNRLLTGCLLALIGLVGCDRPDPASPSAGDPAAAGAARVSVPALPSGYLEDSGQQAIFLLTISGAGMQSRRLTWEIPSTHPAPVLIEGIPAGVRLFHGSIARIDANKDTVITHTGEDSALIQAGDVADVRLYLRADGIGSARVCVTVEGWPADSSCIGPPPPPPVSEIQSPLGCWSLVLHRSAPDSGGDSVLAGHLVVVRRDSMLAAELTWSTGRVDTTSALYRTGDPVAYFGEGAHGDFLFKAFLDRTKAMHGYFLSGDSSIEGMAEARVAVCLPDTLSNRTCFDFKQYHDSATVYGRVGIETRDSGAIFYVHWQGIGARVGTGAVGGDLADSGFAEWEAPYVAGAYSGGRAGDSLRYRFETAGGEARGGVSDSGPWGSDSTRLAGLKTTCTSLDFRW